MLKNSPRTTCDATDTVLTEYLRILVIMPAWVGDMVMAQSLLKYLKSQHPKCAIDIVAPTTTCSLSTRMPEVRHAFALDIAHGEFSLKKRWQQARQLRKNQYDWAIVLPNSWKSALLPWLAHIPQRTGWRGEFRYGILNDIHILDKKKLPLMLQRFFQLAQQPHTSPLSLAETENFWPSLHSDIAQQAAIMKKFNLDAVKSKEKHILAICPGAEYGPAKRWPAEYYAELAQTKIHEGWHVWIIGGPKDAAIAEIICAKTTGPVYNFCGKTNLTEAIDLLALTDLVVTNDSGLMHVAGALQRSIVAIYGSSSTAFTPPLAKEVRLLSLNLSCSPCFARTCKFEHYNCLRQLRPEQVYEACQSIRPSLRKESPAEAHSSKILHFIQEGTIEGSEIKH